MGRESAFQAQVLRYLNSLPDCKAENVSGNAMQSGRPDINGCYRGHAFKLELKVPDHKNTTSKKQDLELRKWAAVGCSVGVIYSMRALKDWVDLMDCMYANDIGNPRPRVKAKRQEGENCESWFWI